MQNPTLIDYVYGNVCADLEPIDRAILIEREIQDAARMSARIDELTDRVMELEDAERGLVEMTKVLRELVVEIDGAKIGKTACVGSLIVAGADGAFANRLGDALRAARDLL